MLYIPMSCIFQCVICSCSGKVRTLIVILCCPLEQCCITCCGNVDEDEDFTLEQINILLLLTQVNSIFFSVFHVVCLWLCLSLEAQWKRFSYCLCTSYSVFQPLSLHLSFSCLWQCWTGLSWTAVCLSPGFPVSLHCLFMYYFCCCCTVGIDYVSCRL